MKRGLNHEADADADEPEKIIDAVDQHTRVKAAQRPAPTLATPGSRPTPSRQPTRSLSSREVGMPFGKPSIR
jgi:hypothetical protein